MCICDGCIYDVVQNENIYQKGHSLYSFVVCSLLAVVVNWIISASDEIVPNYIRSFRTTLRPHLHTLSLSYIFLKGFFWTILLSKHKTHTLTSSIVTF